MDIISCSICKKPFQSYGGKVCTSCLERMDKDFIKVRDYIYENKHARIDTVSEETGVPKHIIMYLLKDGRLSIDDPSGESPLHCEICKKPISTGRMCKDCKGKVALKMQSSLAAKKPADPAGKTQTHTKGTAKLQS